MTKQENIVFGATATCPKLVVYIYDVYGGEYTCSYEDCITLSEYLKASEVLAIYNAKYGAEFGMANECVLEDVRELCIDLTGDWYHKSYGFDEINPIKKMDICNAWARDMYDI